MYNSSSYLVYSCIILILLSLFIYSIRYLRDHNIWFEEPLDFKNRTLIAKFVSVIFLARYVIYAISDVAYVGLSSTPTPNPQLANFLFAHHLFRYRLAVETNNPTIKTPISISFLFLTDMIDSLVYAIFHFFIIAYLEYKNNPVSSKEILYPVSDE